MNALSTAQCMTLGAIGAAVVAVATYPLSGASSGYTWLLAEASTIERLGFGLRLVAFCGLGAFWGYLHRPEHDLKRAFQIGLAAPAAIMGMIYANDVGSERREATRPVQVAAAGPVFPVLVGPSGEKSVLQGLVKGLLGR